MAQGHTVLTQDNRLRTISPPLEYYRCRKRLLGYRLLLHEPVNASFQARCTRKHTFHPSWTSYLIPGCAHLIPPKLTNLLLLRQHWLFRKTTRDFTAASYSPPISSPQCSPLVPIFRETMDPKR